MNQQSPKGFWPSIFYHLPKLLWCCSHLHTVKTLTYQLPLAAFSVVSLVEWNNSAHNHTLAVPSAFSILVQGGLGLKQHYLFAEGYGRSFSLESFSLRTSVIAAVFLQ